MVILTSRPGYARLSDLFKGHFFASFQGSDVQISLWHPCARRKADVWFSMRKEVPNLPE